MKIIRKRSDLARLRAKLPPVVEELEIRPESDQSVVKPAEMVAPGRTIPRRLGRGSGKKKTPEEIS